MKSMGEVTFYTARTSVGDVSYTHECYMGASMFQYYSICLPKRIHFLQKLYGVTESQGQALLQHWNTKLPTKWEYKPFKEGHALEIF